MRFLFSARRVLVACLVLCSDVAFAQPGTVSQSAAPRASIEGLITFAEQPGHPEAIPGISVTLTVSAAAEPLSTTTDAEGRYKFTELEGGTYKIEVLLQGFKPVSETILLHGGAAATLNVAMELDKVIQSIEVKDRIAGLPTDTSDSTASSGTRSSADSRRPAQFQGFAGKSVDAAGGFDADRRSRDR
jgi:hypothetical protein